MSTVISVKKEKKWGRKFCISFNVLLVILKVIPLMKVNMHFYVKGYLGGHLSSESVLKIHVAKICDIHMSRS